MKKLLKPGLLFILILVFHGCSKNEEDVAPIIPQSNINANAIILDEETSKSLISVDPTQLVFNLGGKGVDKIKVGSIIVSDMTSVAPNGLLRKVTSISTTGNTKVLVTEDAALTDVIINGSVKFTKVFTDSDILAIDSSGVDPASGRISELTFNTSYDHILYDKDNNRDTENDQIKLSGELEFEPTLDFELNIEESEVVKFSSTLTLKNTNNITVLSEATLGEIKKEIVLRTFRLKPFTITIPPGVPVPIAKQWIVLVLGVDGSISAKISAGATNENTAVAGVSYVDKSWDVVKSQQNSFTLNPLLIEGNSQIEPWLMLRYELSPYGIKSSRIYVGVRGSAIGEGKLNQEALNISLKYGVKFSAVAQVQVFSKTILNYEKVFYENQYPVYEKTFVKPQVNTTGPTEPTATTVKIGGEIVSNGGSEITAKGICFSTSPNPTLLNNVTNEGSGNNSFVSLLSNLTENTTYYARAYANNVLGTAYGNEITYTPSQSQSAPVVTTLTPPSATITSTSAKVGGEVVSIGSSAVVERGVYWGTFTNPENSGTKLPIGVGIGVFETMLSNLNENTTYYVKAYAKNAQGEALGSQQSFTTSQSLPTGDSVFNPNLTYGTLTDQDGNVYKTISIGNQTWMAENLKTTKLNDGTAITIVENTTSWNALTTPGYSWYNNDASYKAPYGALYNFYAVNTGKLCPSGWHVPSDQEWMVLEIFLGMTQTQATSYNSWRGSDQGTKLKSAINWKTGLTGNNTSGFSALPGGQRNGYGVFTEITEYGHWHTSTTYSTSSNYRRSLGYNYGGVNRYSTWKKCGYSVRCLKD